MGSAVKFDPATTRILAVDGNPSFLMVIRTMLRGLAIGDTVELTDPHRVLTELHSGRFDCLIIGMNMPKLYGAELVQLVRNHDGLPGRDLPIILMSARTDRATVQKAVQAGADEVLFKPISASALHERLKTVIEAPRRRINVGSYHGPERRRGMPNWELRPDQRAAGAFSRRPSGQVPA